MRYFLLVLIAILASCNDDTLPEDVMLVELESNEEYVLDLGLQKAVFRPEGIAEAEFIKQATKATESQLQFVVSGLGLEDPVLYRYIPEPGFKGRDYVEFVVCFSENCASENTRQEVYKIQFRVR